MARITFSLSDDLEPLIEPRVAEQRLPSVSAYICGLVERDLSSAGILPGTPKHDIRAEALAVAEIAGDAAVLTALRTAKEAALVDRANRYEPEHQA